MGTERGDVDVVKCGFEKGDGEVVLIDVRYGRCNDVKMLNACLAAVSTRDEPRKRSECG